MPRQPVLPAWACWLAWNAGWLRRALTLRRQGLFHDQDRLDVDELLDAEAAVFTAVTAVLDPTERQLWLRQAIAVDVDHAGVEQVAGNVDGMCFVAGENAAAKAIAGIIGDTNRLLFVLHPDQRGDRAEQLLVIGRHARCDVFQHSGRIEETNTVRHCAAERAARALFDRARDLIMQGRAQVLARDRAEAGIRIGRIAVLNLAHVFNIGIAELLVHRIDHDEALGRDAGLASVVDASLHAVRHGFVDVGVGQYQIGIIAAQLQHRLLQAFTGLGTDDAACARAAGKVYAAYIFVLDQGIGLLVTDQQHAEDVPRQAGITEQLFDLQRAAPDIGRMLEQHGVAGHDVGDAVAKHLVKWKVPGLDAED